MSLVDREYYTSDTSDRTRRNSPKTTETTPDCGYSNRIKLFSNWSDRTDGKVGDPYLTIRKKLLET